MAFNLSIADFTNELLDHDRSNISQEKLSYYTKLLQSIGGLSSLDKERIDSHIVTSYYKISSFYYRNFHSSEGAMHLPIAENPSQKHLEKLLFQANAIANHILEKQYKQVLELGCGMGFNANYLANKLKDVQFTALDLTPQNIRIAKKNALTDNINFTQGNFDNLSFENQKFDLIYGIETLCHSKKINELILNLEKLLNPKGKIIIFDGYIKSNTESLKTKADRDAYNLISWGFAMERFQTLEEVLGAAEKAGLQIDRVVDYSQNVLSNLLAFQKGAIKTLNYSYLLRFFRQIHLLPLAVIKQITAGLFGAHFVQTGFLGYYKIELSSRIS